MELLLPLTTPQVYAALEVYGPQARPYNFDDLFDCWGLVRAVFAELLGGYEMNEQLGDAPGDARNWQVIGDRDELLPGDVVATHAHPASDFHVVIYYGKLGGDHLVYDSSPRADIPLYSARFDVIDRRAIFTRYGRATETTDRLRYDGGAYVRLWDDRTRYFNKAVHAALVAGGEAGCGRSSGGVSLPRSRPVDPRTERIEMGLSPLPFYNLRRLSRDAQGARALRQPFHAPPERLRAGRRRRSTTSRTGAVCEVGDDGSAAAASRAAAVRDGAAGDGGVAAAAAGLGRTRVAICSAVRWRIPSTNGVSRSSRRPPTSGSTIAVARRSRPG